MSIYEVVQSGLCIGCGLCEAITNGRTTMAMTTYGALRPTPLSRITKAEESLLLKACPGVITPGATATTDKVDEVWGPYVSMRYAWATDKQTRFQGSTAGVLTALAAHLLETGNASFVLHVSADAARPMQNRWYLSESPADVLARAGSRYAPTAPLAGLQVAIDRDEPFVIVAKPCDIGAVVALERTEPRLRKNCVAYLVMVCGGQSRMSKSQKLVTDHRLDESDVALLRYRGFGNPGPTRLETRDGRVFETTYNEQWDDQASWDLETRCKLCPDALGESADIAVADVWPNANPVGEDEGFSGVIVRTTRGRALLEAAVAAGDVTLGEPISPREFDDFQPHQVSKKIALRARYAALTDAGLPTVRTTGLRLEKLAERLDATAAEEEYSGTLQRIRTGRVTEPVE